MEKHGISFRAAARMFFDENYIEAWMKYNISDEVGFREKDRISEVI